MRWTVHGERVIYDSEWIRLALADVELPSGKRFEHHVVRMPYVAAGTVVDDPARGVLLLWRHRFTTDTWGWEIPGGRVDEGETPAEAASREAVEEAGWRPGPADADDRVLPAQRLSDIDVPPVSPPRPRCTSGNRPSIDEAERVEWLGVARSARRDAGRPRRRRVVVDGAAVAARRWGLRDRWQTDGMNSGHVGVGGPDDIDVDIDDIDDPVAVTISTTPAAAAATETSVIRTTRSCCPGGSTRSTSPSSS